MWVGVGVGVCDVSGDGGVVQFVRTLPENGSRPAVRSVNKIKEQDT